MRLSRNQLILALLLVVVVGGGLAVGLYLTRQTQTTQSEAAEETPFATIPPFNGGVGSQPQLPTTSRKGDCNSDGEVNSADEACFMQLYLARDPAADLDNSGQVNSIDLTIFRNLVKGRQ